MIKVQIHLETDDEFLPIAQVRIKNTSTLMGYYDEDEASYVAEFILDEGLERLTLISKQFWFRRKEFNVLALLREALSILEGEELRFHGEASAGHMAWGLKDALREIERRFSELHHNRSTLRHGKSQSTSEDSGG